MAPEPHNRPRPLLVLAEHAERARRDAGGRDEVATEVAIAVVLVGVVCCSIGVLVAPTSSKTDVAESWFALVTGTLFWAGAFIGAVGLILRMRRGLLGALVCALSFLGSVAIDGALDPSVIGARWAIELACALVFAATVVGALLVSRPELPRSLTVRQAHQSQR